MPALRNRVAGLHDAPKQRFQWRNTLETFGLCAQLFHTVIGVAVIVMLAVGFSLKVWPESLKNYGFILHMGLGLWILAASVAWIVSWLMQPTPQRLPNQSRFNYLNAKLVHKLLLVLCVIMPVSGWIMASAFGNKTFAIAPFVHIPAIARTDPNFAKAMWGVHIVIAWTIIGLLVVHTAGALYHHLIKRDPILKRILPRLHRARGHHRFRFDDGVSYTKKLR